MRWMCSCRVGQQLLVHERPHLVGQHLADLLALVHLEQAVNTAEGLCGRGGVDCPVHKVARLGGVEGRLEGFLVAHFTDEHDVGVLTHQGAREGDLEVQHVDADLAAG